MEPAAVLQRVELFNVKASTFTLDLACYGLDSIDRYTGTVRCTIYRSNSNSSYAIAIYTEMHFQLGT